MTDLERTVIEAARDYCRAEAAVPKPGSIVPFRQAERALKEAVAAYEEARLSDGTWDGAKDRGNQATRSSG